MSAGLRCGSTTIKYLLFFFNFLFVLCGLVILVLGGLAAKQMLSAASGLSAAVVFIIVVGACIFVISFFGCCGAVRESHCMLVTFACLLMAIIVFEIVAAVMLFVVTKDDNLDEVILNLFVNARDKKDDASVKSVDVFQESLQCCGYKDPSFWKIKPASCCAVSNKESCTDYFQRGCRTVIIDIFRKFGISLGIVSICVAVVEILGVWFALALAGDIKRLTR